LFGKYKSQSLKQNTKRKLAQVEDSGTNKMAKKETNKKAKKETNKMAKKETNIQKIANSDSTTTNVEELDLSLFGEMEQYALEIPTIIS
jgi:hypothetical protein